MKGPTQSHTLDRTIKVVKYYQGTNTATKLIVGEDITTSSKTIYNNTSIGANLKLQLSEDYKTFTLTLTGGVDMVWTLHFYY